MRALGCPGVHPTGPGPPGGRTAAPGAPCRAGGSLPGLPRGPGLRRGGGRLPSRGPLCSVLAGDRAVLQEVPGVPLGPDHLVAGDAGKASVSRSAGFEHAVSARFRASLSGRSVGVAHAFLPSQGLPGRTQGSGDRGRWTVLLARCPDASLCPDGGGRWSRPCTVHTGSWERPSLVHRGRDLTAVRVH